MIETILQSVEIVIILFAGYFALMGRKNDEDLDKQPLSFFILGLFFLVMKLASSIALSFGVSTLLLNSATMHFYSFLTPLCFVAGSILLRKESDYAY